MIKKRGRLILPLLIYNGGVHISRTKFNVDSDKQKRTYNDIVFDSVLEMKYYRDVVLPLMESGGIVSVKLQEPYELQQKFKHDNKTVQPIKYVADFVLEYADGHIEVVDTKGMPDSTAILKRKMFWFHYPNINYKWVSHTKATGWIEYDELKKIRNQKKKEKKNQSL